MSKIVTTIKGPAKTYKTAMLIFVANEEVQKGREVRFFTSEEGESSLRSRGLDPRVIVVESYVPDNKDRFGKVTSTVSDTSDTHVWRVRQSKKKE